jgi:hypothetical protein
MDIIKFSEESVSPTTHPISSIKSDCYQNLLSTATAYQQMISHYFLVCHQFLVRFWKTYISCNNSIILHFTREITLTKASYFSETYHHA